MSTIRIIFNGNAHTVDQGLTLQQLLQTLNPDADASSPAIASAVNSRHVAKHARASLVLNDQDVITTFEPISGG